MPDALRFAVLGAGIGGLVAALELERRGARIELFEASERVGGAIRTVRSDGYIAELGPNTISDRRGALHAWIERLGLTEERAPVRAEAKRRYIVRDGRLVAVPMSVGEFLRTPLLSARAKARLIAEPLIRRRDDEVDESLYNLVRRRMGEEAADYLIDPVIAGTWAGSARRLSSRTVFRRAKELERDAGSILSGAIALALRARAAPGRSRDKGVEARGSAELINFRGGLEVLTSAMAARIEGPIHLGRPVAELERRGDRWQIGGAASEFDGVVVALGAPEIAALDVEVDGARLDLSAFESVRHAPVALFSLGFERAQIAHPLDGFGVLVPSAEPFRTLGAVFNSSIFDDRAPEGHVLLTAFVGGRDEELGRAPAAVQLDQILEDLEELLGIEGAPAWVRRRSWARAIPQYEVGYERARDAMFAAERRAPGLWLTGTWRDGISVPDAAWSAERCARRAVWGDRSAREAILEGEGR